MKEAIWLACKAKRCCHTAIVVPSGRDVWRISRALDAPPWAFLKHIPGSPARPDAFRLAAGGPSFRLALAKGPTRRMNAPAPCVFLIRTRHGYHRCGLGGLRPMVCQTFPSEIVDGVLCVRNDGGCSCRQWSLSDVDLDRERELVETRQAEAREYHDVVAAWNAQVDRSDPTDTFEFPSYCAFVLRAYDDQASIARTDGVA